MKKGFLEGCSREKRHPSLCLYINVVLLAVSMAFDLAGLGRK